MNKQKAYILIIILMSWYFNAGAQINADNDKNVSIIDVDLGWSGNSINTVVFRKNALVSYKDYQFISYYNNDGTVVLGKRKLGQNKWQIKKTKYKGNIHDAHNCISIIIDGEGYLHIAWDHHNSALKYCRSVEPLSLELTDMLPMLSNEEKKVSYPEFYTLPDGDLLFFYRDGGSGNGNLVMNKYNVKEKKWNRLQSNLIDGEGKRNAYWQACIDVKGDIHISWVWRESPDVASNHDMCYAVSRDGGVNWEKSNGERYQLPITMASAENICAIAQNNELINQTSMCTDHNGDPYIASYWKGANNLPQYHIIYKNGNSWKVNDLGFRKTAFSLSGTGTKHIPVSRPQIISWGKGKKLNVAIIFRDEERGSKVTVASTHNISNNKWILRDLSNRDMGGWEPTFDTELWKQKHQLDLFVQQVVQADAEGITNIAPRMVQVLEYKLINR